MRTSCRRSFDALSAGGLRPLPSITSPFVVGLGHSMGGLLVTAQQAHHGSFDALILAGHSGMGLPEVLTNDELAVTGSDLKSTEEQICSLARLRFAANSSVPRKQPAHGTFFADDVPAAVRQAFADQAVPLLPSCGLTSMIPDSARAERAIDRRADSSWPSATTTSSPTTRVRWHSTVRSPTPRSTFSRAADTVTIRRADGTSCGPACSIGSIGHFGCAG